MPDSLRTPAWRLIGLTRSEPGVLAHEEGRLTYWTEEGLLFDVPLAEVADVAFPWYYFSGGVKLTADGEAYRFSFVEPNDAGPIPDSLLNKLGPDNVILPPIGVAEGRSIGQRWKPILAPQDR